MFDHNVPKWKKDEFSFTVSVNEAHGIKINVPKPIYEKLGSPEKIKFVIRGKSIILE